MNRTRLFVRVVESGDGTWQLRRGREDLAVLDSYDAAMDLATRVAEELAPSAIFVHRADNSITRINID